jgi:hypothetical protein
MTDPPTAAPLCDQASQAVLDEAITSLGIVRDPDWLGDAGVRLHVLASLIAQATALLPPTVAEARQQGYSWGHIGQRLGIAATTAKRHFHQHALTNPRPWLD